MTVTNSKNCLKHCALTLIFFIFFISGETRHPKGTYNFALLKIFLYSIFKEFLNGAL